MTTIYRIARTEVEADRLREEERAAYHDVEVVVMPPRHWLDQAKMWRCWPGSTNPVRVADMDARWALNAYEWLQRRARRLEFNHAMYMIGSDPFGGPRGEMACDAFDNMLDERAEHPHTWLDSRPLTRALLKRWAESS